MVPILSHSLMGNVTRDNILAPGGQPASGGVEFAHAVEEPVSHVPMVSDLGLESAISTSQERLSIENSLWHSAPSPQIIARHGRTEPDRGREPPSTLR